MVTEFVGLRTRLLPGMEDAYEAAHRSVWPELLEAERAAGIKRWLIFRAGLDLFHVVECDNWERASAHLSDDPVDRRWQLEMGKYTEPAIDQSGPASDQLRLIYHGEPPLLSG